MDPSQPTLPPVSPTVPLEAQAPDPDEAQKRISDWKTRVETCKSYRKKLIPNWRISIDYRRGKPFQSQTDEDRIAINQDWSLTKTKQAALFSQVPQVRLSHAPQSTESPWVHIFEQQLNDRLIMAGVETALDEELPDLINAAGFGAVIVSYDAITRPKSVPTIDLTLLPPQIHAQILQTGLMPDGTPIPTETVPEVVDKRYTVSRISPSDFLWPINFIGSDFDNAPWIGRSGRITWDEAKKKYSLTDEDKAGALGDTRTLVDRLTQDIDKDKVAADEMVNFDEIFYKELSYDSTAESFSTIHHLVFLSGKDKPVVDEPWKGQSVDPNNQTLVGALRFPVRVITLAYLTDEAIPPSDSAVGRPQVNELNKLRTQNMMQRARSIPMRWMDINRVDPTIQYAIMKGTYQGIIPVQGQGDKILGEVAKAAMSPEHGVFEALAKSDLNEIWSIGPNQLGSGQNVETRGEAQSIESNFQTRINRERAKVGKHFCTIAEVLGGLMCLYEDPSIFGEGFDPAICKTLSYSILADSTVLLDSTQKLKRMMEFVNFTAKSGFLNLEPVLKEIATLSGLDPNQVIQKPEPKPPVEPSISLRLTGVEDLMNPLTLAFLLKSGQAPSADLIQQAKALIESAVMPPPITVGPPSIGPDGTPIPAPTVQDPNQPPVGPNIPPPAPPPPTPGQANPDMSALDRVNKRVVER